MATVPDQLQHQITIGPSPLAAARIQAALIAGDVETGQSEPPGSHVKYVDKDGKDESLSPAQLNAKGVGNCASIPRAAAPSVNASHVLVVPVKDDAGRTVRTHTALVREAAPGEAPLAVGPDGRVPGGIPPERIVDPNRGHGMAPIPPALYQEGVVAPIYPHGSPDLSHVHDDPAARAAEGHAHQGEERAHTPTTGAGATVAQVSHLAARLVTPHPAAEPRPVADLYPEHPLLSEVAHAEEAIGGILERHVPWRTTKGQAQQYLTGLALVAQGKNPAPLAGDPAIGPEHVAAAEQLGQHVLTLAAAAGPPGPKAEAAKVEVAAHADRLATADRGDPGHDAHATAVSEIDAMLPGAVPPHVRRHLPRLGRSESAGESGGDDEDDLFVLGDALDDDRGDGFMLGAALPLALERALDEVAVGHPHDGRRRPRPSVALDPRMGAVAPPSGGGGGGSTSGGKTGGGFAGGATGPGGSTSPSPAGPTDPTPLLGDGGKRGERGGDMGERHRWDRGGQLGGGFDLGGGDLPGGEDGGDDDEGDDTEGGDVTITRRRVLTSREPDEVVRLPGETRYVREPDRVVDVPGAVVSRREPPRYGARYYAPQYAPQWRGRPGWAGTQGGGGRGRGGFVGTSGPGTARQNAALRNAIQASSPGISQGQIDKAAGGKPSYATIAAQRRMAGEAPLTQAQRQALVGTVSDPGDVGMGGVGDWLRPDRYLYSARPMGLRQAIDAYRAVPWVRARLDAGGTWRGFSLADVQAATTPFAPIPLPVYDPGMGGPGKWSINSKILPPGGGGSGGYPGKWKRRNWQQPPAQTVVQEAPAPIYLDADGNPIDPTMGGIGDRDGFSGLGAMLDDEDDEDDEDVDVPSRFRKVACARCAG